MSCRFRLGQETIWSPSAEAGRLYVAMTRCLAAGGGRPTGVKMIAEDIFDIDMEPFTDLVEVVYKEYFSSGDRVYRGQLHGWLLTSLVLLTRIGVTVNPSGDEERDLLLDVCEHAEEMP